MKLPTEFSIHLAGRNWSMRWARHACEATAYFPPHSLSFALLWSVYHPIINHSLLKTLMLVCQSSSSNDLMDIGYCKSLVERAAWRRIHSRCFPFVHSTKRSALWPVSHSSITHFIHYLHGFNCYCPCNLSFFFFFFMLHATSAWLSTFPFWIISYAILDAFNCALFELCIHKAWRMQDSMTVIDKHCSLIHPAKNDGVLHGKVCLMWMRPLCYSCAIVSAHDKALVLCWLLYLHKRSLVPMVLYSLQSVPC